MQCIVELFGDDRNGRKMIAWGRRIGSADAGRVFDAERRKVAQTFRPRFHSPCRFDILFPAMLGQSFTDFIFATNTDGSGKAASYVRALEMRTEFAALKPKERKKSPEYKAAADQFAAVAEKAVAELRDKFDSEYKSTVAASFQDEDIFMAIADDISFDATGKPTKVNELDEIDAELAKFISKERGDE